MTEGTARVWGDSIKHHRNGSSYSATGAGLQDSHQETPLVTRLNVPIVSSWFGEFHTQLTVICWVAVGCSQGSHLVSDEAVLGWWKAWT